MEYNLELPGLEAILPPSDSPALRPARGLVAAFDYTLNPYVGCAHQCSYCYAQAYFPEETRCWGTWVKAKTHAVSEVSRAILHGKLILLASGTDPYQPVEAELELTRRILKALLPQQPKLIVQTRSPLVLRDLDVLEQFKTLRVQMSVPTDNDAVREEFEPRAPTIGSRMHALATIRARGLQVGVQVAPILPIRDLEGFAEAIRALSPERVVVDVMHERYSERHLIGSTPPAVLQKCHQEGWGRIVALKTADALAARCSGVVCPSDCNRCQSKCSQFGNQGTQ
jgi:DNA repair photolyase